MQPWEGGVLPHKLNLRASDMWSIEKRLSPKNKFKLFCYRTVARLPWFVFLLAGLTLYSVITRAEESLKSNTTPLQPQRLSQWLLQHPYTPEQFPMGLSWLIPQEMPSQNALRLDILKVLAGPDKSVKAPLEFKQNLKSWFENLPVTGRVAVASTEAHWLEVNPKKDPLLLAGHQVIIPNRPSSVLVIVSKGETCRVAYVEGREARDYIRECDPQWSRVDWAWVAQPDGRVDRVSVGRWNAHKQDLIAPGAWVFAPHRGSGWSQRFAQQLIQFLATQGPSEDRREPFKEQQNPIQTQAIRTDTLGSVSTGFELFEPPSLSRLESKPVIGGLLNQKENNHSEKNKNLVSSPSQSVPVGVAEPLALSLKTLQQNSLQKDSATSQKPPPEASYRSRDPDLSTNDWGVVGLLQTPTARMQKAGHFAFSFSHVYPYDNANLIAQPLDWLEGGFRYSTIENRLYGTTYFSGNQTFKDKSFDAKLGLWGESAYWPAVAVGLRDAAGTGLFSSQYLVANKRFGNFDASVGLAWGYLAGQAQQPVAVGSGGTFSISSYFRGVYKPFGGVQYRTPWDSLSVKLEYAPSNYQNEPMGDNQKINSHFNVGLVYHVIKGFDVAAGFERGNTYMLGATLHAQLDGMWTPKINDEPKPPFVESRPSQSPDWTKTAADISRQVQWPVGRIEMEGKKLNVLMEDAGTTYWQDRVEKVNAVLHRDAPSEVDQFVYQYKNGGMVVAEQVVDRQTWVASQLSPQPPHAIVNAVVSRAPQEHAPDQVVFENTSPRFESGARLGLSEVLDGPSGFIKYQVYALEQIKWRLGEKTWLDAGFQLRLIDNYGRFASVPYSALPKVRTHLVEYLKTSHLTMPNLQITHMGQLSDSQYYSVYGGYLEPEFAGVGGEWLYRPFASRFAFGVDVNAVKQRNFSQNFGFNAAGDQTGYRVATGHATAYWDTGWNDVNLNLSAGRYLAKDVGATVGATRTFKNGVSVGAFVTRTNVSAAQFGEGSFDKGVYLNFPFDALMSKSSNTVGDFLWRPLTRDGGAKLARSNSLYGMTGPRSRRTLELGPADLADENVIPEERKASWVSQQEGIPPYTAVTAKSTTGAWLQTPHWEQRLIEALDRQQFKNIQLTLETSHQIKVTLANDDILPLSRAAGRAARVILSMAPVDLREIHITLATRTDPQVRYEFMDLPLLNRYFNGEVSEALLANVVAVKFLNPAAYEVNPLSQLANLSAESGPQRLKALIPETLSPGRLASDVANAARETVSGSWMQGLALAGGVTILSSVLDKPADRIAKNHATSSLVTHGITIGNAIPWLGLAGAGLLAFDGSDPRRSVTGYAAAEAGTAALLLTTGLKTVVSRARPETGLGNSNFNWLSSRNNHDSFPSNHAAAAWAVVTPFAKEYEAPWLYGIATLTDVARVAGRQHWVSDTVAGSLIGYGLGNVFWASSNSKDKLHPKLSLDMKGIRLLWQTD